MELQLNVTTRQTEAAQRRSTFALRVYTVHGSDYPDQGEHLFTDPKDPLVTETLLVLQHIEETYDGWPEDENYEQLVALFSKDSVELAYELIGGDILTDCDQMATMTAYEITWFDKTGSEFEVDFEVTK